MLRKMILFVLCYGLFFSSTYSYYCALDCENLKILESNGENHIQSVASISKVMSALVVLEHASLREMVEIQEAMLEGEGSSIYLTKGEIQSIETLLHGLMLRSGNDAALALALYVSNNDLPLFVKMMNDKALSIGMFHTKFENPSGLEQPQGNQSTPYDMALLMCYASQNKQLVSIMQAKSYTTTNHETWFNKNRLLKLNSTVLAGKTGFTHKAGRTLLSVAANPNHIAIATFRHYDDFKFHDDLYQKLYQENPMIKLFSKGIYYYRNQPFLVNKDGYISAKNFDSNKVKVKVTSDEIIIHYDTNTWHFSFLKDK